MRMQFPKEHEVLIAKAVHHSTKRLEELCTLIHAQLRDSAQGGQDNGPDDVSWHVLVYSVFQSIYCCITTRLCIVFAPSTDTILNLFQTKSLTGWSILTSPLR